MPSRAVPSLSVASSGAAATAPVVATKVSPLVVSRAPTKTRRASSASTTAVTPAAVEVVATPTFVAATSSLAAATPGATTPTVVVPAIAIVAESLFPTAAFFQFLFRGRPQDRVVGLVVSHAKSLHEGKNWGGSILPAYVVFSTPDYAPSTEHAPTPCSDAFLTDARRRRLFPPP